MLNRIGKIFNPDLLKAIVINIFALAALVLLFDPAVKVDDYRTQFILSGGATGIPSCHLIYSSVYLGLILEVLTAIFPGVPWYIASQYIFLFLSLSVMTYMVLKKKWGVLGYSIITALLFVFGYEVYIKLTFSKTAGVLCAAGMVLLWDALYKKKSDKLNSTLKVLLALGLVVFGAMYRIKIFYSIFALSIYIILYRSCCFVLDTSKEKLIKKIRKIMFSYVIAALTIVGIFSFVYTMKVSGEMLFSRNPEWKAYKEWNVLKSDLQDYGWPDYDTYEDEYVSLGISKTDYAMWKSRNYSDLELFDTVKMQEVVDMKDSLEGGSSKTLNDFFTTYPKIFLEEESFAPILLLLVLYVIFNKKHRILFLTSMFSMLMLFNAYLFFLGRHNQHHVNVGIWFLVAMITISCMKVRKSEFKKSNLRYLAIPCTILFMCQFVYKYSDYLTTDNYYAKNYHVSTEIAQEFIENCSADKANLYVTNYNESRVTFVAYGIMENIPPTTYSNIFCLVDHMYPSHNATLKNYGISNIYRQIVNNSGIYYFESLDTYDDKKEILNYINENYHAGVYATCVREIDGIFVYRFFVGPLYVETSIASTELDNIVNEVTCTRTEEGINFNGLLYKDHTNSFTQKVYLEMIDQETGHKEYQILTLHQSSEEADISRGKYSLVDITLALDESRWDAADTYNLILDCENGRYIMPITVFEK